MGILDEQRETLESNLDWAQRLIGVSPSAPRHSITGDLANAIRDLKKHQSRLNNPNSIESRLNELKVQIQKAKGAKSFTDRLNFQR